MNNYSVLLSGELQRMKKYYILTASFVISLLWIGVMHFAGIQDVTGIFPLLVFLDATSMSMLMVGVTMFYERHEGAIKSLLVSPVNKGEYILAKTFANVISGLETLILLYIYAQLFKEIHLNFIGFFGAVMLISLFHALMGGFLTYYSKDFTGLLMGVMKYSFIMVLPIFFEHTGILTNELAKRFLYVLPTKASMVILTAPAGGVETIEVIFSVAYLALLSLVLYNLVLSKFDEFAVKESGI